MRLYVGLVHYPVYNKNRETIASAITTIDLHDIARLARTFDVKRFFVINPLEDQQRLAERVISHWTNGYGANYNQDRKKAIERVSVVSSIEDAVRVIDLKEGESPLLVVTDASLIGDQPITYERARDLIEAETLVFLLFGTAWGLERTVTNRADFVLTPIRGRTDYNHLSVRTAAAIILDRLAGDTVIRRDER